MYAKEDQLPADIDRKRYRLNFIHQTLKSYKPSPNGSGIKWSKEEREIFAKLSLKEQRKMIVRKSELKSILFPYVDVDYEPYKYSERISDSARKAYQKAKSLLNAHKGIDFNYLDSAIQQQIFNNLRIAYHEQYLKAGVELAKLLFKKAQFAQYRKKGEIEECAQITKKLLPEKIPENAYMYYQLYKWAQDIYNLNDSYIHMNREEAKECYNYALETAVWEAIDEEAQREQWRAKIIRAELWLAAAIKYQSPSAFSMAASSYCPEGPTTLYFALIPHHACLRCSIALGNSSAIASLEEHYRFDDGDFLESPLKAKQLRAYAQKSDSQKGLINGLDPYFDEKFPPDEVLDLSSFVDSYMYGGTIGDIGIAEAKRLGWMKDPRDKDATPESIKEYYVMMWKIIIENYNDYTKVSKIFATYQSYFTHLIYSHFYYGYPSARPYIFPKEVLDLEIDFDQGLDQELKDAHKKNYHDYLKENGYKIPEE